MNPEISKGRAELVEASWPRMPAIQSVLLSDWRSRLACRRIRLRHRRAILGLYTEPIGTPGRLEIGQAKGGTMKIVVIGGTGLIGSKLVEKLREDGRDALAASPDTGVDTLTGEGLAEALAGAQVVVDVANAPDWEDAAVLNFFQTSSRNILAAEAAAGVKHHVVLSVVGTDRLPDSG